MIYMNKFVTKLWALRDTVRSTDLEQWTNPTKCCCRTEGPRARGPGHSRVL